MFSFSLVATKNLEYSNRETFFGCNRAYSYRETVFWASQVIDMSIIFLITLQPNEMHHFPHISPPLLSPTKSANRSIGVYQSHPTQQSLLTVPLVHCRQLQPSVIMLPPSATSRTRSTSPSHAPSLTPHHTQHPSWRNIGCSSLRRKQYSYVDYGPPTSPCPSTINQMPLIQLNVLQLFEFTSLTSATSSTRSMSPSRPTSLTPLHTRRHSWRSIGCSSLCREQYSYIDYGPPTSPCPSTCNYP